VVDVNIKVPSKILQDVLDDSCKRKADDSTNYRNCKIRVSLYGRYNTAETTIGEDLVGVEGDRMDKLEYCIWDSAVS